MAKVIKNAILEGLRGQLEDLVLRQYGHQMVVSQQPVIDPTRVPTPGEAVQQARIKAVAAQTKTFLATKAGRAYLRGGSPTIREAERISYSIHDYFDVPDVLAVDCLEGGGAHPSAG